MSVEIDISKANEMLSAEYMTYYNPETDIETVRTLAYSIPADLKGHIDVVHPTIT